MAWVRLDDQVPRHQKMLKAGPAACWLWVCAIAHCQSQLTDGFVSLEALPMIGVTGLTRCRRLADVLVAARLFDRRDGGYVIHDYLAFNDTREEAVARKEVMRAQRRHAGLASGRSRRQVNDERERTLNEPVRVSLNPIPSHPIHTIPEEREKERERAPKASLSPPADPFVDQGITERAGRFIDRYEVLYQKHRHGARYARKPVRDYAAAVTLCQTWIDDGRLDKLAVIFLTTDHKFAEEGSRTIPQFLGLASWCDGKLAEHEAKQRTA